MLTLGVLPALLLRLHRPAAFAFDYMHPEQYPQIIKKFNSKNVSIDVMGPIGAPAAPCLPWAGLSGVPLLGKAGESCLQREHCC